VDKPIGRQEICRQKAGQDNIGRQKAWKASRKTEEASTCQHAKNEARRRKQANRKIEGVDKPIGRQQECSSQKLSKKAYASQQEDRRHELAKRKEEGVDKPIGRQKAWTSQQEDRRLDQKQSDR
jgi:hypothetical protein